MELPIGYSFIEAKNSHGEIADEIISTVLHEYGLGKYTHHSDSDFDEIESTYSKGFFGLIKNEKDEFVGTFGLISLNDHTAEIRKMYLLPAARGNGLGKWMINFLIKKARELNFQKVELETASVLIEAMNLYKKVGFQETTASNASPRCDRAFEMKIT